jgi:hypothetical protein
MSEIEHYKNYRGPKLVKAVLNNTKDITDVIQEKYGGDNNWNNKLWYVHEVFGNCDKGDKIYCEFISKDGRKHWFYTFIDDKTQYFNPPLVHIYSGHT